MNVVILMGRLATDPEMMQTQNGITVTRFRIAVPRDYSKGGNRETDFLNCIAWRNTAEFVGKWFKKGKQIAIRGSLQSRNYTDKNDVKRTAYEVIVESAQFAGEKNDEGYGDFKIPDTAQKQTYENVEEIEADVDLPF